MSRKFEIFGPSPLYICFTIWPVLLRPACNVSKKCEPYLGDVIYEQLLSLHILLQVWKLYNVVKQGNLLSKMCHVMSCQVMSAFCFPNPAKWKIFFFQYMKILWICSRCKWLTLWSFTLSSGSQTLLWRPQVLPELSWRAPQNKLKFSTFYAEKLNLFQNMKGFTVILFSGAPQGHVLVTGLE